MLGFREDFFGAGTLAVPVAAMDSANQLGWMDIGISHQHGPYVQDGRYYCAYEYESHIEGFVGLHLVLDQRANRDEKRTWHLNQDLVLALGLMREEDIWISPDEGYVEVARLRRRTDGTPHLIEIRAEHLRDYLCAREMALYVTSYRNRQEVVEDAGFIDWPTNPIQELENGDRWEGRTRDIHEGGQPFGSTTAVFHVARTDVDADEDVPEIGLPSDEHTKSESWTVGHQGRKLSIVQGELWRNEWVKPASRSERVRGERPDPTVFFITDAEGTRENRETLESGGRWLWSRPEVVMALAHRRGGGLAWYTRQTGSVRCSPDYDVHFGVNDLGLVNVYAKDVALLPDWQQRIWAGYNMGPEGGVSEELLASQARAEPAETKAPEAFLQRGLEALNSIGQERFGVSLLRPHAQVEEILDHCHRFRAVDRAGLFALAKDLARLTADSIDASAIHDCMGLAEGDRPRSLKSLERLVAEDVGVDRARELLGPLVGVYELRLADAHLPSSDVDDALKMVHVDPDVPHIHQGLQLLDSCVGTVFELARVLRDAKPAES